MLSRLAETGPAQLQAELRGRAERMEGFIAAVRELADEGGDSELVAVLHEEAEGAAVDLAEAGVEVLRELQRERAIGEALVGAYQAEVDAARQRVHDIDARILRIKDTVIRPACEKAGKGNTRALRLVTARVSIVANPPKVELEEGFDPALLPEDLQHVVVTPRKLAIRARLVEGEEVPGCFLVATDRVEVRG